MLITACAILIVFVHICCWHFEVDCSVLPSRNVLLT